MLTVNNFLKILFINFYREGREKEERNIDRVASSTPQKGDPARNPGMCPCDLLVCGMTPNPLSHTPVRAHNFNFNNFKNTEELKDRVIHNSINQKKS